MARERRKAITLVTKPFRMAFPALFEPEQTDSGERYKVTALFPSYKDCQEIEDAMHTVMEDAFGPKADWPRGRNDMLPDDKLYPAEKNSKWNGFKEGWFALPMSSQEAPGLVDANKQEVLSKREIYGGRWARAQIVVTTYDNKSKGVGVYLNHVQLLDHDEAFSGRGNASDAFQKYEMKDRGGDETRRERGSNRDADTGRRDTRDDDRGRGRDQDGDRERNSTAMRDRGREDRGREDRGREDRGREDRGREDRGQDRGRGRREARDDNDWN